MKTRFFTTSYRYCFIFLLSIVIVCAPVSDGHTQNYYPDEFGNTWVLQSTDGGTERIITIEGPETIGAESLKVISDRTGDNTNKFFIKSKPDGVLISRATATVAGFDVSIDYSPPETFLPIPVELGSEWTVTGEASLGIISIEVTNVAKVVDVEPITVPAGTFQGCLEIEQHLSSSGLIRFSQQSTMWLAPDIGIVKALSSNDVTFELIDYNIAIDGIVVAVEPKGKLAMTWGALKKR